MGSSKVLFATHHRSSACPTCGKNCKKSTSKYFPPSPFARLPRACRRSPEKLTQNVTPVLQGNLVQGRILEVGVTFQTVDTKENVS